MQPWCMQMDLQTRYMTRVEWIVERKRTASFDQRHKPVSAPGLSARRYHWGNHRYGLQNSLSLFRLPNCIWLKLYLYATPRRSKGLRNSSFLISLNAILFEHDSILILAVRPGFKPKVLRQIWTQRSDKTRRHELFVRDIRDIKPIPTTCNYCK